MSLTFDGLVNAGSSLFATLLQFEADNMRHPFWEFDWSMAHGTGNEVALCTLALGLTGILCAAGGIGGGGIYVTLLMIVGGLSTNDAIPISKVIVLLGSIPSLILNLRKTASADKPSQGIIDFSIYRLVEPAAVLGTLWGVFANRHVPESTCVAALIAILLFMTYSTVTTFVTQRTKEVLEEAESLATSLAPTTEDGGDTPSSYGATGAIVPSEGLSKSASTISWGDLLITSSTLVIVVLSSVFQFHADECRRGVSTEVALDGRHWQCQHPAVRLFGEHLEEWVKSDTVANLIDTLSLAIPTVAVLFSMWYYGTKAVEEDGYTPTEALKMQGMAIFTGFMGGLVGIGGGLIYAPFFLAQGMNPAIAVATSSTCVTFTAASTSLQFLLSDRVIMSLALIYGCVTTLSSFIGTRLVHAMHDRFAARKSYIIGIVATGVALSLVLALAKLVTICKFTVLPTSYSVWCVAPCALVMLLGAVYFSMKYTFASLTEMSFKEV